jgi:hypothetical protein
MQGKRLFNKTEERRIRELISKKVNADRSEQKRLRQELRDIGFYISDFTKSSKGFTLKDFELLKHSGQINIT